MRIVVCLKHVPQRVEIDPLTGALTALDREAGLSAADEAALETGLTMADRFGATVTAITAGPVAAATVLRAAAGVGVASLIRVDSQVDASSAAVAASLASAIGAAELVLCGDYSDDRGSGSVPAFLAAGLHVAQALGVVAFESAPETGVIRAVRRLDRGRREVLDVPFPAVISVEGSIARLRRGALRAVMAASSAPITLVPTGPSTPDSRVVSRTAYRPRTKIVAPPSGHDALDRVRSLTATGQSSGRADPVAMTPEAAAQVIIERLG